ncbi:hypothetical protein JZO67_001710 [Enterococcus sp. 665A]|uniref:Uncharacterized protein n=1 Tax=Candidatus Enterococcus ferrettii TaxID=2815324 RepID=A0ABV0EMC4_9ENTE
MDFLIILSYFHFKRRESVQRIIYAKMKITTTGPLFLLRLGESLNEYT